MNGPHDLGGQDGFGPVAPEPNEPTFHAPWERRALGVTLAAGAMGGWTIDESRHARECLRPVDYYSSSYYEIWIKALEVLLRRHGFVSEADLAAGYAVDPGAAPRRVLLGAEVAAVMARGTPYDRPATAPPAFAAGDAVRTRVMTPPGHTRLPRYARGKLGRVETVQGCFVLPDTNARGAGERPGWVYSVVIPAIELWGREDADPLQTVAIDAWETYLEPA